MGILTLDMLVMAARRGMPHGAAKVVKKSEVAKILTRKPGKGRRSGRFFSFLYIYMCKAVRRRVCCRVAVVGPSAARCSGVGGILRAAMAAPLGAAAPSGRLAAAVPLARPHRRRHGRAWCRPRPARRRVCRPSAASAPPAARCSLYTYIYIRKEKTALPRPFPFFSVNIFAGSVFLTTFAPVRRLTSPLPS